MANPGQFQTTRWSVVLAAGAANAPAALAALESLCQAYWYPLYTYARRRGYDPEAAGDVIQGFFARLLERGDLTTIEEGPGRFRAYLLAALRNHMVNERNRARTLRRGGGEVILSLDVPDAEGRYGLEPATEETPERAFDRTWAQTLVDRAMAALEADYDARGKAELYAALRPALGGEGMAPYAELAARFGSTDGAIKVAAHRLRAAFRHRLRREVAETLAETEVVEDELLALRRALTT